MAIDMGSLLIDTHISGHLRNPDNLEKGETPAELVSDNVDSPLPDDGHSPFPDGDGGLSMPMDRPKYGIGYHYTQHETEQADCASDMPTRRMEGPRS
jgi:hypothetical protein